MALTGHIWKCVGTKESAPGVQTHELFYVVANGIDAALMIGQEQAVSKQVELIGLLQEDECSVDSRLTRSTLN